jgi:hypothetical protein
MRFDNENVDCGLMGYDTLEIEATYWQEVVVVYNDRTFIPGLMKTSQ